MTLFRWRGFLTWMTDPKPVQNPVNCSTCGLLIEPRLIDMEEDGGVEWHWKHVEGAREQWSCRVPERNYAFLFANLNGSQEVVFDAAG